jgi:hypothetical protein
MITIKLIGRREWKKYSQRMTMCDSCKKVIIPIEGFCTCGMSLVAIDRLIITNEN